MLSDLGNNLYSSVGGNGFRFRVRITSQIS